MPNPQEIQSTIQQLSGNPDQLRSYLQALPPADYNNYIQWSQVNSGSSDGSAGVLGPALGGLLGGAIGTGASALGSIGSLAASHPWYTLLGLGGAAVAGKNALSGGGGSSGSSGMASNGTGQSIFDKLRRVTQGVAGQVNEAGAAKAASDAQFQQLLAMMGAGSGSGSGTDYGPQYMNAETQRMLANAQIADMMYQRTQDEAKNALARGDLQLAREKFQDSQVWSARSADANDEANRLHGIDIQSSSYGKMGDLQLGALDTQTKAYGAAGGLTNDATGLQLSGLNNAGQLEQNGYATQGDILGNAGKLGVSSFSATEDALSNRANVQARGAENYSNLTNIIGNLGSEQAKLALQIATTPRNAIAGFLMGRGQNGGLASAFNPGNLLGINPQMIQDVISKAMASAGQVGVMPAMQQFDTSGIINGMIGAGTNAANAGVTNAAQLRDVANAAPGRVANDVGALRTVGANAPGAVAGAVSGLANAAAGVANKAPATIPAPPTSMAPYQATLNQMISQGAPQEAVDAYRNNLAAAGYGVQ